MKMAIRLLCLLVMLGFVFAQAQANPLYEIDMEKCPAFLAKLRTNQGLAQASRVEEIFAPFKVAEKLTEDILDRRITWKIICYDIKISHELRTSTKDTCETLIDKVTNADPKLMNDEQKRTTLEKIRTAFKKRKEALEIVTSRMGGHPTEYPVTLWNAYVSRLLLGINEDIEETSSIKGGDFGKFDFVFDMDTKRQIWNTMLETGILKSKIDMSSFKYSPTETLSQTWRSGKYKSIIVGCGRFDRRYVANLLLLDEYNLSIPTAMNCGCCTEAHVEDLTINFDPIQMPDVIADGLNPRVWDGFADNSILELKDESGHDIFLKHPDILKTLWVKLKSGGSIPGRFYTWAGIQGINKPDDIVAFGKGFGFDVEFSIGQDSNLVNYKFTKP